MTDSKVDKRKWLVALISLSGLFGPVNSSLYVNQLSNDEVVEMISALTNNNLQPAQFVAAVTRPGKNELNTKENEIRYILDLNESES